MTKGTLGFSIACMVILLAHPAFALTCQEEITRLAGLCAQEKGLDNARACREESTKRIGDCRNWKGEMADFTGKAEEGRNDGSDNVYMSCDEKRRQGYVLEPNEVDYCGGLQRK